MVEWNTLTTHLCIMVRALSSTGKLIGESSQPELYTIYKQQQTGDIIFNCYTIGYYFNEMPFIDSDWLLIYINIMKYLHFFVMINTMILMIIDIEFYNNRYYARTAYCIPVVPSLQCYCCRYFGYMICREIACVQGGGR